MEKMSGLRRWRMLMRMLADSRSFVLDEEEEEEDAGEEEEEEEEGRRASEKRMRAMRMSAIPKMNFPIAGWIRMLGVIITANKGV
jgi:CO dehydrogenase/acetyl-CoA synthase beta subunit